MVLLESLRRWKIGTGHIKGKKQGKHTYIKRYGLVTPLFQIWFHKILPVPDIPAFHNHVTNFISIPLNGSYEEIYIRDGITRKHNAKPLWPNLIKKTDYHQVFVNKPVYTISFWYGWKWEKVKLIVNGRKLPYHKWIEPYF